MLGFDHSKWRRATSHSAKRALATAALIAVGLNAGSAIGAASAADMAVKAFAADPSYNWTGWYAGLNAGGDWGTANSSMSADLVGGNFFGNDCQGPASECAVNVEDVARAGKQRFSTSGFTGGFQGGYNWQSRNLLLGVEADFEYFRSVGSGSNSVPLISGVPAASVANISTSTDWLFTLRPRAGLVQNNWLFYATGVLAVTQLRAAWNWRETAFGDTENASTSSTQFGWTVGGGVETMLPQNWIL